MPDAIILAGGGIDEKFQKKYGVTNRALLAIHGRFMIEYVIEALKVVPNIDRIVVVGSVYELKARIKGLVEEVVPSGKNPFESTVNGLNYLHSQERVLVLTSDIPLLKGEMIQDFLYRCDKRNADFYYPIIRKEVYQKKFGNSKRTFACLREGCFSGGNMFYVDPVVVRQRKEWIAKVISQRKNPAAIARLLGARIIIKFLLRRVSIRDIEERVQKILGMHGLAVITPYPEIGFDVDAPEHAELIRSMVIP